MDRLNPDPETGRGHVGHGEFRPPKGFHSGPDGAFSRRKEWHDILLGEASDREDLGLVKSEMEGKHAYQAC